MDTSTGYAATVAAAVREAIENSGVTVVWLCETTGIPRTTLTRRLAGHASFTVAELDAIASALRIPVVDLTAERVA